MKYKLLERNLEYIVDEIYYYHKDPYDMEYFVSIYLDEDRSTKIVINDIWSTDYAIQIYDFRVEEIADLTKDELRNILKENLKRSINSRINELELLIANSKDFIKNNIDDIVKTAKDYHTHHDIYYLVIGIQDSNLYYQFDTLTEIAYLYPIYDTSEDISEVSNQNDFIRLRLMDSLNSQVENWKTLLKNLKERI